MSRVLTSYSAALRVMQAYLRKPFELAPQSDARNSRTSDSCHQNGSIPDSEPVNGDAFAAVTQHTT